MGCECVLCPSEGWNTATCIRKIIVVIDAKCCSSYVSFVKSVFEEHVVPDSVELKKKEFSLWDAGSEEERLDKVNRFYTMDFRFSPNNHYYISIKPWFIRQHIWKWVGCISDCYSLHARWFDSQFFPFTEGQTLAYVHESDEEEGIYRDHQRHRLAMDDKQQEISLYHHGSTKPIQPHIGSFTGDGVDEVNE